ncbi:MAG: HNH endonuclease signature motif containing protein [Oscillospiraceae bacterium]
MTLDFSKYVVSKSDCNNFSDNDACRVAAYFVQQGRCYITGLPLEKGWRELHHRQPRYYGGEDIPENLILLNKTVHLMVHVWTTYEFNFLLQEFPLTAEQFRMVNQLRYEAHRPTIKIAC